MKKSLGLGLVFALVAVGALADTPAFSHTYDNNGRVRNVPFVMPADIGDIQTSAPWSEINVDRTCDGLSTHALYVESQQGEAPFQVDFLHTHTGGGAATLSEREIFSMKMSQDMTDGFGMQVGFTSQDQFEFFPVQFGPSSDPRFGEIYVDGLPSGVLYGSLSQAQCTGVNRFDPRVDVTFDVMGTEGVFFITIQSNAPVVDRATFGPFAIPQAVLDSGYGSCAVRGQSGMGMALVDGPECIVASILPPNPLNDGLRTDRTGVRR